MAELTIHDGNYQDFINPIVDGVQMMHGCIPRNFMTHPIGHYSYAKPFDLNIPPESQWEGLMKARIDARALLSDVRNTTYGSPMPSRDQNGKGYCWAHSGTSAHLIARAKNNLPYVDLSAYMVACIIKGYRDEGGWGAEGVEFQAQNGCPDSKYWPQQSMESHNDNETMRANAKLHRYTNWRDCEPGKMREQFIGSLLMGFPCVVDYNWWSHSVCAIDLISLNPLRVRIWNSWGDKWSENGTGILEGSKALPDACLPALCVTASAA